MRNLISRRDAIKRGGNILAAAGAVAVSGAAMLPATANAQGTDDRLRTLLVDLETYDGDRLYGRHCERQEIAARLRAIVGGAS